MKGQWRGKLKTEMNRGKRGKEIKLGGEKMRDRRAHIKMEQK